MDNGGNGIEVSGESNRIVRNTVSGNGGVGIAVGSNNIASTNRIAQNYVTENMQEGKRFILVRNTIDATIDSYWNTLARSKKRMNDSE